MFRFKRKAQSNRMPEVMIVGLGNPGGEYEGTRHNVGFAVIDALASRHKVRLATFKNHARYATWEREGRAVLLVKPMAFMNRSGQPVAALARQFSLQSEDILVVSDDLDLPVGTVKMKPKGGSGGHNGHKSIAAALGSDDYPRIKVGIGKAGEAVDHVLSRFDPGEKGAVATAIERCVQTCERFVAEGVDSAMKSCNTD